MTPDPNTIPAPGEVKTGRLSERLLKVVQRAEYWAGTMPAKEAVKLRPSDWHAVCYAARDAAAALAASPSSEVTELRNKAEQWRWLAHDSAAHADMANNRVMAAEAERDTALTAITDARQALAEAGCDRPFLDDGLRALVAERDAALAESERLKQQLVMAQPLFSRRQLEARMKVLSEALRRIRDQEWVENCLDPQWAASEARSALSMAPDGDKEDGDGRA